MTERECLDSLKILYKNRFHGNVYSKPQFKFLTQLVFQLIIYKYSYEKLFKIKMKKNLLNLIHCHEHKWTDKQCIQTGNEKVCTEYSTETLTAFRRGSADWKLELKFYDESHKMYLRQILLMLTRTSLKFSNYIFSMYSHPEVVLEQRLD